MKKSIIKNVIALTFALGALVFVAGNVFGNDACPIESEIGEEEVDYRCRCGILTDTKKCLSKNHGSKCAPKGTVTCQDLNSNCGG